MKEGYKEVICEQTECAKMREKEFQKKRKPLPRVQTGLQPTRNRDYTKGKYKTDSKDLEYQAKSIQTNLKQ